MGSSDELEEVFWDGTTNERSSRQSRHQLYRLSTSAYRDRERERESLRDRSERSASKRKLSLERPFVGWDTEGTNVSATPFLFGSSEGDRIAHEKIHSEEMFDLLLEAEERDPNVIHVIYGGEYDFNMMLRDLSVKDLRILKNTGKVTWNGYKIEHVPRKWLQVKRDKTICKIFDVVSFFGCGYVQALEENKIGDPDTVARIKAGKAERSTFTYDDISYIEPYWRSELELLPRLMDKLRDAFYRASVYIRYWHGPGAIARYMLREHGVKEHMAEVPADVHTAARYAFCGGRFEPFQAGLYDGRIYNADINSAYPFGALSVPSLSQGDWEFVDGPDLDRAEIQENKFALYNIRYLQANRDRRGLCLGPQPLFRRMRDDRVTWPQYVQGWYWTPEAHTVANDGRAEFLGAWIFTPNRNTVTYPFEWLGEYYDRRTALKSIGDSMQLTYKLGINSVYGQTAQRAGWQHYGGKPTYHQIEWAGYITSVCRAAIYRAAVGAWGRNELISIDTDGIFTTGPIPEKDLVNGYGDKLGQWGADEYEGMLNLQSGVYWMPDETGKWELKKSRGAPKGKIPFEVAKEAVDTLGDVHYMRNELIGYRWALRNGMKDWRYFVEKPRQIRFGGSAHSKRYHNPRGCRLCRGRVSGSMHDLTPNSNGMTYNGHSVMHVLPWEKNDHDRGRDPIEAKNETEIDLVWIDEG